jgi:hypothetical protein
MVTDDEYAVVDFYHQAEVNGGGQEADIDKAGFGEYRGKDGVAVGDDLDKDGDDGCEGGQGKDFGAVMPDIVFHDRWFIDEQGGFR